MRALRFTLAALALLPACQRKPAEFVGLPYCTVEDSQSMPSFAKRYTVLMRHRDGYGMSPLDTRSSGPGRLGGVYAKKVDLVVLACEPEHEVAAPVGWDQQLADGQVPVLCAGQQVLFEGPLELERSPRAEALGYAGWFRFPELEMACVEGEVSFAERQLFGQIIGEFQRAVSAYHTKHEALPGSLEVVYSEMLEPELPPDPWGNALRFVSDGDKIVLSSAGPDGAFDNDDDVTVLQQTASNSSSILSWPGFEDASRASYVELLERRGVL